MGSRACIVFGKPPILGLVKTRIAKQKNDAVALQIYEKLLARTFETLDAVRTNLQVPIHFYWDGKFGKIPQGLVASESLQVGQDLGERMSQAFQERLGSYDQVMILGTDCWDLTWEVLKDGFRILETQEACVGPAADGGYYLLGMRRFLPFLFTDVPWSTNSVFPLTIKRLREHGISFGTLGLLSDVDRWEDWERLTQKQDLSNTL